jgi:hypothetical protein
MREERARKRVSKTLPPMTRIFTDPERAILLVDGELPWHHQARWSNKNFNVET